jgi:hypothetical protein
LFDDVAFEFAFVVEIRHISCLFRYRYAFIL